MPDVWYSFRYVLWQRFEGWASTGGIEAEVYVVFVGDNSS